MIFLKDIQQALEISNGNLNQKQWSNYINFK